MNLFNVLLCFFGFFIQCRSNVNFRSSSKSMRPFAFLLFVFGFDLNGFILVFVFNIFLLLFIVARQ